MLAKRDIQKEIGFFRTVLPSHFAGVVEKACRENLDRCGTALRSGYRIEDQPHRYQREIFRKNGLSSRAVFDRMRSNGLFTAPTTSFGQVYTGKIETLWSFDMIVRLVDEAEMAIYNVTLPYHIFFPGFVKFTVTGSPQSARVDVLGLGRGNWEGFNRAIGPILFTGLFAAQTKLTEAERPRIR